MIRAPSGGGVPLSSQIGGKMRDHLFSAIGTKVVSQNMNLFKDLTVEHVSYLVNDLQMGKSGVPLKKIYETKKYLNKVNNYRLLSKEELLERVFSLLYLSMFYYDKNIHRDTVKFINFMIRDCYANLFDLKIPQNEISDDFIVKLMNFYHFQIDDQIRILPNYNIALVREALTLLQKYITLNYGDIYSMDQLPDWLMAISASSITTASLSIKDRKNVPDYIIRDFLTRQPRNVSDLNLLLEQFDSNFTLDVTRSGASSILRNLINGCISYDSSKLGGLILHIVKTHTYKLSEDELVIFVNKLIMLVSETNVRKPKTPFFYKDLQNTQTMLVDFLKKRLPDLQMSSLITVDGYIGLVSVLEMMDDEKSTAVFNFIESEFDKVLLNLVQDDKFVKVGEQLTPSQKQYYKDIDITKLKARMYSLRLLLAQDIKALTYDFEMIIKSNANDEILIKEPKLWRDFVLAVKKFNRFDPKLALSTWNLYSRLVLEKFEKSYQFDIDSRFIAEIIDSVADIRTILSILRRLESKNYQLNAMIVTRVIKSIYYILQQREFLTENIRMYHDGLSFVRSTYKNYRNPNTVLISTMLMGECRINPAALYDMYRTELQGKRKDENSIMALCIALINQYNHSTNILEWRYEESQLIPCYQVCVKEFSNHVLSNKTETSKIYPTEKFLKTYVEMLAIYREHDEILRLFSVLEDLDFKPSESLLLHLLTNIDMADAMRILKHIQNLSNSGSSSREEWPWPDEQIFINHKHKNKIFKDERERRRDLLIVR